MTRSSVGPCALWTVIENPGQIAEKAGKLPTTVPLLSLERLTRGDVTHVEDLKDLFEVHSPFTDRLSIIIHAEEPSNDVLFALLDDLPLDLGRGPAIEILLS